MPPHPEPDLTELQRNLGHEFSDPSLLRRALAHRSWCAEVGGEESNERLEFLGDAVLGWVIAELAFRQHTDLAEGKLTDLRKSVVNASALAEVAVEIGIGPCLLLGKGESAAGGRSKPSILSDAFEAVLGAVYLDGGAEAAATMVERLFAQRMASAALRLDRLDYKTVLQELTARRFDTAPVYVISDSGPDHEKRFFATVIVAGQTVGKGEGRSKKLAEQAAAEQAWLELSQPVAH
ncbi:MAG TPA: ribonuclease III [Acidimicrobiaceae bacterium]|nr:ribonuclease III [Acidimicrobiaceae bacterium]